MNNLKRKRRGFTIIELAVVMLVSTIISAVLLAFYTQARLSLNRGVAKTALQQKVRTASIRIIPKITSTIRRPADPTNPDPTLQAAVNPIANPAPSAVNPDPEVLTNFSQFLDLNSSTEFVKTQLRQTLLPADAYDPRMPSFGLLRIQFNDPNDAIAPINGKGLEGDIVMYDPNDLSIDHIVLSRGLDYVGFQVLSESSVRMRIEARGQIPSAVGNGSPIETVERYDTDIYLPVFTSTAGGTGVVTP